MVQKGYNKSGKHHCVSTVLGENALPRQRQPMAFKRSAVRSRLSPPKRKTRSSVSFFLLPDSFNGGSGSRLWQLSAEADNWRATPGGRQRRLFYCIYGVGKTKNSHPKGWLFFCAVEQQGTVAHLYFNHKWYPVGVISSKTLKQSRSSFRMIIGLPIKFAWEKRNVALRRYWNTHTMRLMYLAERRPIVQ